MIRRKLRRWIPTEETLRSHRSLRWMGPLLRRPWLWQLTRRRVAAGAAIGVFFGFLVPVLQIAGAAAAAIVLRANLPVAAAATLVSNPFTYAPIWVAAYQTGAALLGKPVDADKARERAEALVEQLEKDDVDARKWTSRLLRIGKPLMLGLTVFAVVGAVVTWVGVNLLWRLAIVLRMRGARRAGRAPPRAS